MWITLGGKQMISVRSSQSISGKSYLPPLEYRFFYQQRISRSEPQQIAAWHTMHYSDWIIYHEKKKHIRLCYGKKHCQIASRCVFFGIVKHSNVSQVGFL